MRVRELAEKLSAEFEGDGDHAISGVAELGSAGPGTLAFAAGGKAEATASKSRAGCLLVGPSFHNPEGRAVIRVPDPRAAFARAVRLFCPSTDVEPGIHPTAVVDPTAVLAENVSVGPHAVIGSECRIGAKTVIGPGSVLGDDVQLGEHSFLHANVTVYDGVRVGSRAIIHSGAVLGADGFGFVLADDRYEKFPQIGSVEIGDDVEIGANCCIDRAALGVTSIGDGTKLDNMVHIAHNCRIGRHVVIAAQTGFSGGVEVGDFAVIGGQVGVGDKAHIESRAVLGSGSGVLTSKVVKAGPVMWGTPAQPLKEYLTQLAALRRLPKLREEVAALRKQVEKAIEK